MQLIIFFLGALEISGQRNTNLLYLLTPHNNGSLNLWNLTFEDNGKFNLVVSISHASRMCGHRFRISQVVIPQLVDFIGLNFTLLLLSVNFIYSTQCSFLAFYIIRVVL